MAFEKKDNSGALFKAKPNDNPNWPQYEGWVLIDGREYWQSAWVKDGASGSKFFSQSFKPKDGAKAAPKVAAPDEDIPF